MKTGITGSGKTQIFESLIGQHNSMTERSGEAINQGWFAMLSINVTLRHNWLVDCVVMPRKTIRWVFTAAAIVGILEARTLKYFWEWLCWSKLIYVFCTYKIGLNIWLVLANISHLVFGTCNINFFEICPCKIKIVF